MKMAIYGAGIAVVIVGAALAVFFVAGRSPASLQALSTADLRHGAVDFNGDGVYSSGDDWFLDWVRENAPHHLEASLREAKLNEDGGVDLSSYFVRVSTERFQQALAEANAQEKR